MASESSVILQSRLTRSDSLVDSDLPGNTGFRRFELATPDDFSSGLKTERIEALPGKESDRTVVNVIVTGMKYEEFQNCPEREPERIQA